MTDLAMLACASDDMPPWAAVAMVAIVCGFLLCLIWMAR
jgi:hypothetical protein